MAFFFAMMLITLGALGLYYYWEFLGHLVAGFYFFLRGKIPAISVDAATLIPGLGAFLLALAIAHCFLRSWASKHNRNWSFSTTVCCGLLLPVLFAIAFIVPGVIFQVNALREVRWFEESPNMRAHCRMELRGYAANIMSAATDDPQGRLPESLDAKDELEHRRSNLYILPRGGNAAPPYEPTIYLGSGLTLRSDPGLPLCISTCYLKGGKLTRWVITLSQESFEIQDSETDAWIRRGLQRPAPEKP